MKSSLVRFETVRPKRFLTALLSSVILAIACAQTCAAQAGAGEGRALFPVFKNGKCGFRDREGRWVIAPRFDYCDSFEDGMAEVWFNNRRFYVDTVGRLFEDHNFASNRFSEGLIPVNVGGKYGFADASGRLAVFPSFEGASDFAEGLAPVKSGGKWGYIDRAGALLIAPRFDYAEGFSEGLAEVCFKTDEQTRAEKAASASGESSSLLELFSNEIKRKCGFIDRTGALVIEPQFNDAGKFSGGLAPVYVGRYRNLLRNDTEAGKWGYVNRQGRMAMPLQYVDAKEFSEGLAAVKVGKKWGFIDATGALVIPPRFEWATEFKGGLALVALGETKYYWPHKGVTFVGVGLKGRYGYVDRTGEFVSDKLTWKGKWKK